MSAGLPLPGKVFGHGFLLNRGEKMSKSVGNVADPLELAAAFGVDQLRYFLLREVSFGQDGSYSNEAIVTRTNARSEEHTSELQSLMRISYAVFCLKKKKNMQIKTCMHG